VACGACGGGVATVPAVAFDGGGTAAAVSVVQVMPPAVPQECCMACRATGVLQHASESGADRWVQLDPSAASATDQVRPLLTVDIHFNQRPGACRPCDCNMHGCCCDTYRTLPVSGGAYIQLTACCSQMAAVHQSWEVGAYIYLTV
jgi:hypothetical protein